MALDAAHGYEALQLSPVAPLGVCSVLAPTSQDRTLSASRGTEVVSDPTNTLALICGQRAASIAAQAEAIRLCTVHQTLRAQSVPRKTGFSRHFRLFALAEAGAGAPEDEFEVSALARQLAVLDRLCNALESELWYRMPRRRAVVRAHPRRHTLAERLERRLRDTLSHLELVREPLDSEYYDGMRVMFGPHTSEGAFVPIGDSGLFDWLAKPHLERPPALRREWIRAADRARAVRAEDGVGRATSPSCVPGDGVASRQLLMARAS